jgi:PKD repeat protein
VNYGDGTGLHPLALSGQSFSLSHTYTAAGTHTVNVTVQDNDGGQGSGTATVTVLTAQQAIAATLLNAVAGLDQSASFSAPLRSAQASLDRGSLAAANGQMRAFLNHVEAAVRSGQLPASTGAELTSAANRIITSMNR